MLFIESILPSILGIIVIVGGLGASLIYAIHEDQRQKLERAKLPPEVSIEDEDEDNAELPLPDVIGARVIKKRVGGECSGMKIPKYNAYFWITFLTDDGKELTFNVSQELFDKTNEGDVASLVTINDTFLDFTDGEEITDNEIE